MNKLQKRLAEKTAAIERKMPPQGAELPAQDPIASTPQQPVGGGEATGPKRAMTMPGQLGAFRLEAQKYQAMIADLEGKLAQAQEQGTPHSSRKIPLELVDDSPYQPRMEIDPEEIDELAKTMAATRQADPIKVRQVAERFELISGHRRVRAARTLGWEDIDAIVEVRTDDEAEVEAMLLVVGSVGLSDYELAKMYARALSKGICHNQAAVATFFATKQPVVSARLDLLKLPAEIISMLESRPRLFGYECGKTIKALIKDHPKNVDVIVNAVRRLGEGMKQSSLKGWVHQTIRQEHTTNDDRKTITSNGRPVFTTKRDPRSVTVACKIPGMDVEAFEERLRAWLQQQAESVSELVPGLKK